MTMDPNGIQEKDNAEILYLAGGCFWGLQAYLDRIQGVLETAVGYANGSVEDPSYQRVCTGTTGYAETVEVRFDPSVLSLEKLLKAFFHVVDPTQYHRQGGDIGNQYRNGIYYVNQKQQEVVQKVVEKEQENHEKRVVTEVEPLKNFYLAEEYHQKYLEKNPQGYCHIHVEEAEVINALEG